MRMLSKNDQEFFKKFEEKYPGWKINRYEDGSLEMIKPERNYVKPVQQSKNILRVIT